MSKPENEAFDAAVAAAAGETAEAEPAEETTEESQNVDPSEESVDDSSPEAAPADPVAAAKEAFDKGDLEALAKALGTTAPKIDNKAFVRMRKAEDKLAEAKRERERQDQLLAEARRMYGPIAKARVGAKKGDVSALKALIEGTTGQGLAQVLPMLAKAANTPSEIDELRRELGELRKVAGRAAKFGELEGHAVTKLEGWQDLVDAAVEDSFDEDLGDYALSPRDAANAIVEKAKKAAASLLGSGPKVAKVKTAPRAAQSNTPAKTPKDREDHDFKAALLAASVARGRR